MRLSWISDHKIPSQKNLTHEFNFDIYGRSFHFYSFSISEADRSKLDIMTQLELKKYIQETFQDPNAAFISLDITE